MKRAYVLLITAFICIGMVACASSTKSSSEQAVTSTLIPTATNTPMPTATNTPVPTPTNTPTPAPTIDDMTIEVSEEYIEIGETPQTLYVRVNENGYEGKWTLRFDGEDTTIIVQSILPLRTRRGYP